MRAVCQMSSFTVYQSAVVMGLVLSARDNQEVSLTLEDRDTDD